MEHRFDSISDAEAAGYERASNRVLEHYRGYAIRVSDTSSEPYFGYSFAVWAVPMLELVRQGRTALGSFGGTVDVWTDDPNRLGRNGSCLPMFPPDQLEDNVQAAKDTIDAIAKGETE